MRPGLLILSVSGWRRQFDIEISFHVFLFLLLGVMLSKPPSRLILRAAGSVPGGPRKTWFPAQLHHVLHIWLPRSLIESDVHPSLKKFYLIWKIRRTAMLQLVWSVYDTSIYYSFCHVQKCRFIHLTFKSHVFDW